MTNRKREEYERVFACLDKNKDGKLSAREMEQCMEWSDGEWMKLGREEEEEEEEEGWLGFEEFVRMVEEGEEKEKERDLKKAFNMYEMEQGSGVITPTSLKRMLSRLGHSHSLHQCHLMISHFDLNGDGFLNFDEFRAMMQ